MILNLSFENIYRHGADQDSNLKMCSVSVRQRLCSCHMYQFNQLASLQLISNATGFAVLAACRLLAAPLMKHWAAYLLRSH